MKVLFANPPWWDINEQAKTIRCGVRAGSRWPFTQAVRSMPDQFVAGDYTPYPFFMGYAASYAAKNTDFLVRFRDSIALKESYQSFIQYVNAERPDYIVLEMWTSCWDHDTELIRGLHKFWPQMKIIVTGPICITKSKEILETLPVVATIKGEYEKGVVRVLKGETGDIGFDILTTEEMNAAPYAYMDHIHAYKYFDSCPRGVQFPHVHVWASRGCVFKCEFCITPGSMTNDDPDGQKTRKMRFHTKDYMEGYLRDLVERFDYKSIYFDDDTFNMGNKHTQAMCDVMEKIGLPWAAMCRVDTVNRDTWRRMKESGCYGVKLGYESGSQYVVDKIVRKGLDLEEARDTTFFLRSIGLQVHGTFTYGHPGETQEQRRMTLEYRKSLPLTSYQESGVAEMDGSPLAEMRKGALKGYEGATMDEGYVRNSDGVKKIEAMVRKLQSQ